MKKKLLQRKSRLFRAFPLPHCQPLPFFPLHLLYPTHPLCRHTHFMPLTEFTYNFYANRLVSPSLCFLRSSPGNLHIWISNNSM